MTYFTKILVAFDGSKNGLKALDSAKQLVEALSAHLTVAYIHEDPHEYPMSTSTTRTGEQFLFHSDVTNAIVKDDPVEVVRETDIYGRIMSTAKVKLTGIPNVTYEKMMGHPPTEIVNYAQANDVDLIIVGNRGLGALKKLFMGSVSQKVTNNAKCSVLIVK